MAVGRMADGRRGFRRLCMAGTIGCLMALTAMPAAGASAEPLEPLFRFGPDGTEASDFGRVGSIALDQQSEIVYVLDRFAGSLFKFQPSGQPDNFGGSSSYIDGNRIDELDPFDSGGHQSLSQVAVDSTSHLVYVTERQSIRAFQADGEPAEFTAGPGAGTSEIPGFGEVYGVSTDVNGNIYVSDHTGTVSVFAPSGAEITSFSVASPYNLVVAPNGAVHVINGTEVIKKFTPDSFPVTGGTTYVETTVVTRASASNFLVGVTIDPVSKDIYALEVNFGKGWIRRYDESGNLLESIGEPNTPGESSLGGVSEGIAVWGTEIEPAEGETIKLYAGSSVASNDSQVVLFGSRKVIAAPDVTNLRVTGVTADSAVLRGSVDPNLRLATYRFEYGLEDCSVSACTSVPAGGASIGEGSEGVALAHGIAGLTSGTTYHYRLLASNELGNDEESGTFTTQTSGAGFALSDARVWEMVSPPNKRGGTLLGTSTGIVQAAEDGNGIAYLSRGSIELQPEGNRSLESSSVISQRQAEAWASRDLTPPNVHVVPYQAGGQSEFKLFTPDLAQGILSPHDGTHLSPQASERTPYLWQSTDPPVFTPLVTGREGFANVPPGTEFGGDLHQPAGPVSIVGANRSLTSIVLDSTVPLIPGAPPSSPALYYWRAGTLQPTSALPASEGGEMVNGVVGSGNGSVRYAVSEDGGRVFWGRGSYDGGGNNLDGLYVRDTETEQTTRLDVLQEGASGLGESRPAFQGADAAGRVVFFKDSRQLTEDASASGSDLYRCELSPMNPSLGCTVLTNIASDVEGGADIEVMGLVSGISSDGNAVYLVAGGDLDPVPNQFGDSAQPGQPNLYRWEPGQEVRFIATLSANDAPNWGGNGIGLANQLSAQSSPSGRYFAFMSDRRLSGQSNHDASTGNPVQGVYVYDAAAEQLQCVSCNPTGAAPDGQISAGFSQLVDPQRQWEGEWVAAILPQPTTAGEFELSFYRPRAVLDNGRVFFNTLNALAPTDSNRQWDVYQFEPFGLGSCNASAGGAAIVRSGNGCVSLLSSGTAEREGVFLDSSLSGDDAFILSSARLSLLDRDDELDVYDARVNGIRAQPPLSSECSGATCRPTMAPPGVGIPSSATFAGSGNVKGGKRCPKGKRLVRRGGKRRCISKRRNSTGSQRQGGKTKGQGR